MLCGGVQGHSKCANRIRCYGFHHPLAQFSQQMHRSKVQSYFANTVCLYTILWLVYKSLLVLIGQPRYLSCWTGENAQSHRTAHSLNAWPLFLTSSSLSIATYTVADTRGSLARCWQPPNVDVRDARWPAGDEADKWVGHRSTNPQRSFTLPRPVSLIGLQGPHKHVT